MQNNYEEDQKRYSICSYVLRIRRVCKDVPRAYQTDEQKYKQGEDNGMRMRKLGDVMCSGCKIKTCKVCAEAGLLWE